MKTIICPHCNKEFSSETYIRYQVFKEKFVSLHNWFIKKRKEAIKAIGTAKRHSSIARQRGHKAALDNALEMIEGRYGKHIFNKPNDEKL